MFAFLICILTVQQVNSACNVQDICPDNPAVQAEIVNYHNELRRAVEHASDMLLMSYDEKAAVNAQAWVDQCILAHGAPSTRLIDGYELGENLFYSSSLNSWTDAITDWHAEVSHYLYPSGSTNGKSVGHYTQVVWNSSYKIGCGVKLCPNGIYFYACHYYRAGNFNGWLPYQEGPRCGSCPNDCEGKLCTNPCPYINKYLNCPTLKKQNGCTNGLVKAWCPAACNCTTEIIPIA